MDIATPLIGFAGVVVTSLGTLLLKHYLENRDHHEVSDAEIRFTLSEINELHQRCLDLEQTTKIDRFLILKAENGKSNPKFASVVFEQCRNRQPFIASLVYTKIHVDSYYQEMLKTGEAQGLLEMETATMPDGARLRGFYESEKVTFSNLYFLGRNPTESASNDKWVVWYCTLATMQTDGFTKAERLKLQTFVDFVKQLFDSRMPKAKGEDK